MWLYYLFFKNTTIFLWLLLFLLLHFPRQHSKVRDSDEENDPDDEDAIVNAVGCLGPFSGLLAPELQKYQKQIKGKNVVIYLVYHNVLVHNTGVLLLLCPRPIFFLIYHY